MIKRLNYLHLIIISVFYYNITQLILWKKTIPHKFIF